MSYKPRLTIPEKGNKYFNRKQDGGYGTSIQGYPVQEGLTCLSNCVGYAAGRFNEIGGYGQWKYFNYPPNAEDFWTREPSLSRGSEPKLGAIICWEGIGSKAGHVAIVEQINSDGSIVTSDSAYGGKAFYTRTRTSANNWGAGDGYKLRGFIYQPEFTVLKRGDKNEKVGLLQQALAKLNWYYDKIDNSYGQHTYEAVIAYQFTVGLPINGITDIETWKSLGLDPLKFI